MRAVPIRFLSVENVLRIHEDTIAHEGGSPGIRDLGLLESAAAMAQAMFGGEFLHDGLAGMAAAYLYHICQNHAFVDGNKRTAAFAAVLFLNLNGVAEEQLPTETELERVTLATASGALGKVEVTAWLRGLDSALADE